MSYGSNTYTYNADGIRTSKTVNGVEHIYHLSGTRILDEEWTEGNIRHLMVYVYDASGQPIGISHYTYNGTIVSENDYLLVSNIQGDIIGIYDSNGTRVVTYVYDAWGRILSTTGTGANTIGVYNPFRYRGYYYDIETGFYYLNSRYYDPNVGRFLNADIYINANGDLLGFNMFAYCSNNPVMGRDPSGTYCARLADDMTMSLINLSFALACIGTGYLAWTSATGKLSRPSTSFPIADIDVIDVVKPVWRSKNREVAIADEAEKVATDVLTCESGKYYGAYINGEGLSGLVLLTPGMSYSEALLWVTAVSEVRSYNGMLIGRNRLWGVFTLEQLDAYIFAKTLSGCQEPVYHIGGSGEYGHYHVNGYIFNGYKHFHMWFAT